MYKYKQLEILEIFDTFRALIYLTLKIYYFFWNVDKFD